MGDVCAKHEQFVPDGERCPYCECSPAFDGFSLWKSTPPATGPIADAIVARMNELWVSIARQEAIIRDNTIWDRRDPLPEKP